MSRPTGGTDPRRFGLSDEDLRELGYDVREAAEGPPGEVGGAPQRPRKDRRRLVGWAATIALLGLLGWSASLGRSMPSAASAAAPDTAFSSARAMAQLVEIARGPRAPGSPEHDRVRNLLTARLRSLGWEPELHVALEATVDSGRARAMTVRNVWVHVPGSAATGALAVVVPYDASPLSPGASDGGAALATVLETARAISVGRPLRNDLLIAFTDGGALGSMGSRALAESDPWSSDVDVVITLETRGASGPAFTFGHSGESGGLVEILDQAGVHPSLTSLARPLLAPLPDSSEVSAFVKRGARGVLVMSIGGAATRNQPTDTPDVVSERTLQSLGQQLMALLRAVGQLDLTRETRVEPDRAHLSVPFAGLVHYPASWRWPIAVGLVAAWLLLGLSIRVRRASRRGALLGAVFGLSTVGASVGAGRALLQFVSTRHAEYGMLHTALYRDGLHTLALTALVLAVVALGYSVVHRWARTDEMLFGALGVALLFALAVTSREPLAAPAVQVPLALALLGGILVSVLGPRRMRSRWGWGVLMLVSGAILLLVVPSIELAAWAWTFREAGFLAGILSLTFVTVFPLWGWQTPPHWWLTPGFGLALGAGLVLVAMPARRGTPTHPAPTTLVYLAEEEAVAALPGAAARRDSIDARRMSGQWLSIPGRNDDWARSWVAALAAGSRDPGVLLLPADGRFEIVGVGPESDLPAPRVRLIESEVAGARRTFQVGLASGLRGEVLGAVVPVGLDMRFRGVGDLRWTDASVPVRSLEHWGRPEGGELVVVGDLSSGEESLELQVIEHHLRPSEVLGAEYGFERPDSLVADASVGSDRAIQRTLVRIPFPGSDPRGP